MHVGGLYARKFNRHSFAPIHKPYNIVDHTTGDIFMCLSLEMISDQSAAPWDMRTLITFLIKGKVSHMVLYNDDFVNYVRLA